MKFTGTTNEHLADATGLRRFWPLTAAPTKEHHMKIRPLQDRLIVRPSEAVSTSKGGIIIPDNAKEKPLEGEVLAVGNGRIMDDGHLRPLDVKAGDLILFGKYTGTEIEVEGSKLLMLREDDVLGVIEK